MGVTCKNLREFTATLRRVGAASKKPEAALVNKALKNVCLRAMQFTTYAEPGLIQAQLLRDDILVKLAARNVAKRAGKEQVDRRGNTKLTKSGKAKKYGKRVTANQIRIEANKILGKRIAGARAMIAGWIKAAKVFGAAARSAKLNPAGSAAKGTGEKATISKLHGFITNALVTRDHLGNKTPVENLPQAVLGLNQAISFVSKDMNDHQNKKEIERELRKYSDK